jgi:shikimate kinase
LLAKVAAAADAEAVVRAQVEFGVQVETEAKAAFAGGLAAPSSAQMNAIVRALLLANMCG